MEFRTTYSGIGPMWIAGAWRIHTCIRSHFDSSLRFKVAQDKFRSSSNSMGDRARSRSPRRQPVPPQPRAFVIPSQDSSCAPTELDPESEDETGLPTSVLPYKQWTNMCPRVRACFHDHFTDSHHIVFDLAPPNHPDWMAHLAQVIHTGLSVPRQTHFKIGVSYTPAERFQYDDYIELPMMRVCLTSEDCDQTGKAEIDGIARFRDDPRCMNIAKGGESMGHNTSPHYLYVVFGLKHQFGQKRK